jgi:hypothetical protein
MRYTNSFDLFTSISPRLGGDELEYHKSCIASWRSAGFEVVTVNGYSEVPRIAALELDVRIFSSAQAGKPLIRDILSCIAEKNCRYAGIINADCALLPYPELSAHLKDGLEGKLVLAERVDVDARSMPQGDSCGGFDAFFFDATTLPSDFDDNFQIGVPWWDYWFPMAVLAEGGQIVNLTTPLLTHRNHNHGWIGTERERVGQAFWRLLKDWRSSVPDSFPLLGHEVDVLWPEDTLTIEQLGVVGSACFQWLRTRQLENDFNFLPLRMEPIETLLRSMRATLKKSAKAEADIAYLRAEAEAERTELVSLRAKLTAVEQSTSWRITKPLRQISSVLRRGARNEEVRNTCSPREGARP